MEFIYINEDILNFWKNSQIYNTQNAQNQKKWMKPSAITWYNIKEMINFFIELKDTDYCVAYLAFDLKIHIFKFLVLILVKTLENWLFLGFLLFIEERLFSINFTIPNRNGSKLILIDLMPLTIITKCRKTHRTW